MTTKKVSVKLSVEAYDVAHRAVSNGEAPSVSAYIESLIIVRDGGLRGLLDYLDSTHGLLKESDPEVQRAHCDFDRILENPPRFDRFSP